MPDSTNKLDKPSFDDYENLNQPDHSNPLENISDHFAWSLLNLFLLFPLGIIGLIFAVCINRAKLSDHYFKACLLSRISIVFCIIPAIFWGVLLIFIFILPPVSKATEASRRLQCSNNIKQILLAFHHYHDDYDSFPPAYTVDENGNPLHSWRVLILPYIEGQDLYEKIRLNEPWDSEWNRQFWNEPSLYRCYQCPSESSENLVLQKNEIRKISNGLSYYSVVVGQEAAFQGSKALTISDFADRLDQTVFIVERRIPVCWMNPTQEIDFQTASSGINQYLLGCGSIHSSGMNIGLGDGSVHFIDDSTDPTLWKLALTRKENQKLFDIKTLLKK